MLEPKMRPEKQPCGASGPFRAARTRKLFLGNRKQKISPETKTRETDFYIWRAFPQTCWGERNPVGPMKRADRGRRRGFSGDRPIASRFAQMAVDLFGSLDGHMLACQHVAGTILETRRRG